MSGTRVFVASFIAITASAVAAAAASPMFYPLSDFAGGSAWSDARAVSGDGSTAVGYSGPSNIRAFRWTAAGGMVVVDDSLSEATAVSHDGSVIGADMTRWTSATGPVPIPTLAGGNGFAFLRGMSGDGNVITGGTSSANSIGTHGAATEAFRWTPGGGTVGLGDLSGGEYHSFGEAVSADGTTIVGGGSSAAGEEPIRWTQGTGLVPLGSIPGGTTTGRANDVNADGSVIIGRGTGADGMEAFRWTSAGGMVGLGRVIDGGFSDARAVSADGSIIVGVASMPNHGWPGGPFIWDAQNGMRQLTIVLTDDFGLDLSGWVLADAQGISADGRTIVGGAYDLTTGQTHGYVAVIPEPASLSVGAAIGALLLARRGPRGR